MKKTGVILLIFAMSINYGFSQKAKSTKSNTGKEFDEIIISGGFGAGVVVSSNVINSGALLPSSFDFLLRYNHNRYGIGITNEIYLTPENLAKMLFGESSNVKKIYIMHEITIAKKSFVNLGLSTQLGWFYVGKERENMESTKSRYFGNIGPIIEMGSYTWQFYIRPAIEYKSYNIGSFHKEIIGNVMIGLRWKIPGN